AARSGGGGEGGGAGVGALSLQKKTTRVQLSIPPPARHPAAPQPAHSRTSAAERRFLRSKRPPSAPTGAPCTSVFFSSRRRHTRWPRDWSSDVCSSDLVNFGRLPRQPDFFARADHRDPVRRSGQH